MFEIVIYGLLAFIILVASTFLFDKMKVKAQEFKAAEEQRKKDRATFLASQPPKPVPRPKSVPTTTPGLTSTTTVKRGPTINGQSVTMQELQDFFNGKTKTIGKDTDRSLEAAMKDIEKQLADIDKIFKKRNE